MASRAAMQRRRMAPPCRVRDRRVCAPGEWRWCSALRGVLASLGGGTGVLKAPRARDGAASLGPGGESYPVRGGVRTGTGCMHGGHAGAAAAWFGPSGPLGLAFVPSRPRGGGAAWRKRACWLQSGRCEAPNPERALCSFFVCLISHQPAVLFSQNKPAITNQPAVLFSQNKPAPAISHQPNEQAGDACGLISSSHRRLDRRNRLPTCDDPNYAEARQRAQASIIVRNRPRRADKRKKRNSIDLEY
jgi:hypothetical protein